MLKLDFCCSSIQYAMKEITNIITAYDSAQSQEKKTALATVVKVDGSAYRRSGARMLVTEDGELTGAISGGCLEGDALRKAQTVIFQQKPMLVTYDTTDEDDQKFGVGLGCNGIIHVLIEPVDPNDKENPIALLKLSKKTREICVLTTIFSLKYASAEQIGTKVLFKKDSVLGTLEKEHDKIFEQMRNEIPSVFESQHTKISEIIGIDTVHVFYQYIKPPTKLLLFGAGNDVIPLVKMAHILGYEITLIDGRKNYATSERFPEANQIIVGRADEVVSRIAFDPNTVVLLMTHNFEYEAQVLSALQMQSLPYIGILGPKKKTEKLKERLVAEGVQISEDFESKIYAPTGLDIGSETPEEIALAILSELQAVMKGKDPSFLRDKKGPIHMEELKSNNNCLAYGNK